MLSILRPQKLELEAIYLGLLSAWRIKLLSRVEYPLKADVLALLEALGLTVSPVLRVAENGTRVTHWTFGAEPRLVEQYRREYEGTAIAGQLPAVVRAEGRYFGYPPCCVEAFIREPYAPNGLTAEEQGLLFHYACPGCRETSRLIPLYQAALAEARDLHKTMFRARRRHTVRGNAAASVPYPA